MFLELVQLRASTQSKSFLVLFLWFFFTVSCSNHLRLASFKEHNVKYLFKQVFDILKKDVCHVC